MPACDWSIEVTQTNVHSSHRHEVTRRQINPIRVGAVDVFSLGLHPISHESGSLGVKLHGIETVQQVQAEMPWPQGTAEFECLLR